MSESNKAYNPLKDIYRIKTERLRGAWEYVRLGDLLELIEQINEHQAKQEEPEFMSPFVEDGLLLDACKSEYEGGYLLAVRITQGGTNEGNC